jgi:tRNA pseudouridine55 synthase
MKAQTLNGLLVIDKPGGMTSRDVVNRVQGQLPRGTRIGHTGTLDPLATGVLVLCLGSATRLAEYVQDMPKTYRAGIVLGQRSDTQDADGTIIPVEGAQPPDQATLGAALQTFVGEIDQVPPAFSAAKLGGRRAYDLARRGQTVTLEARSVRIYAINLLNYDYPRLDIEVHCGKGTYIRSLARDLGERLGCGALIESLRRTRVGPFTVEDAVSVDADVSVLRNHLRPVAEAVANLHRVNVTPDITQELCHGRGVPIAAVQAGPAPAHNVCAAFDSDSKLVAVLTWDQHQRKWLPHKVLIHA